MYEPTFDTLFNTYFIPGEDIPPFPFASIAGGQANPSHVNTANLAEEFSTNWSMDQVPDTHVHGTSYENNVSQDVPALGVAVTNMATTLFSAPGPTCGLAGGLHCILPLDASVKSIKMHLRKHGHRHPLREVAGCPWMGCADALQWGNMPRHILSIHMGMRVRCPNCDKPYTRREGLTRHVASMKCNGIAHASAQQTEESI